MPGPGVVLDDKKKFEYELKDRMSRIQRARQIIYRDREQKYNDANFFVDRWRYTVAQFSLTMADIAEYWQDFKKSLKETGSDIKYWFNTSKFGDAVKATGGAIKNAGIKVKDLTVSGAKAAWEILGHGVNKLTNGMNELGNSKFGQKVIGAVEKTGNYIRTGGAWIKDHTVGLVKKIGNSEAAKKTSEVTRVVAKSIGKGAVVVGKGIATGAKYVGKGVAKPAKKLWKGIKWGFDKVKPYLKTAASKVSEKFGEWKARFTDWNYDRARLSAGESNRIRSMVRARKLGKEYEEKLEKFRKDIGEDRHIKNRIDLRSNRERLRQNVDNMEKGDIGNIELFECPLYL